MRKWTESQRQTQVSKHNGAKSLLLPSLQSLGYDYCSLIISLVPLPLHTSCSFNTFWLAVIPSFLSICSLASSFETRNYFVTIFALATQCDVIRLVTKAVGSRAYISTGREHSVFNYPDSLLNTKPRTILFETKCVGSIQLVRRKKNIFNSPPTYYCNGMSKACFFLKVPGEL